MKDKEPKNPLLVIGTIIFLSLFIILPPVFRKFFPEEVVIEEPEVILHVLSCEKISVSEERKVTSKIYYENDVAFSNIITFIVYTPTEDDIKNDTGIVGEQTIAQEISYLKNISGVNFQENASQTVIEITRENVNNNEDEEELKNYLLETDLAIEYFEAKGFTCIKEEI